MFIVVAAALLSAVLVNVSADQISTAGRMAAGSDRVGLLDREIAAGVTTLSVEASHASRLPALLKQLDINSDSQGLVFSKTSFQSAVISPRTPRAIYFNDNVYVGMVQHGEVFELIATDPVDGLAYYTLDAHPGGNVRFQRRSAECTTCHGRALMVQSVLPGPDGAPIAFVGGGAFPTIDHRTPIESRWGGWYVTGTHGPQEHMGNAVVRNPSDLIALETVGTQNRTRLDDRLDTSPYLEPTSDIVALMTLEHQTRMSTLMTGVARQGRALTTPTALTANAPLPLPLQSAIEEMVVYMLFADEAPLSSPVRGVSSFTRSFPQRGPRDSQGRSLRDFDLETRLFRYPLSYMIYSDAFAAIPAWLRDRIFDRLFQVLTAPPPGPTFASLSASDRRAVLDIVRETTPGLPASWQTVKPPSPAAR